MSRRTWLIFPVALVAFAVLATVAAMVGNVVAHVIVPQRPTDDLVSFNPLESYTLSHSVEGDVFVTGSAITFTADSHVLGDVSLVGEDVTIAGQIDGDLTIIAGGIITLEDSARVNGDTSLFGDALSIGDAHLNGDLDASGNHIALAEGFAPAGDLTLCANDSFTSTQPCNIAPLTAPHASPFDVLFSGLTLAGAAGLAVVVFPRQIGRMQDATRRDPRKLAALGFGVLLLAGGISAVWVLLLASAPPLGVLLIPVYGLLMIGLSLLVVAGWITVSLLVGDILLRVLFRMPLPALIEAIAGTVVLLALLYGVSLIPFGAIAALPILIALTSVGVGAAISTRLGRRPLRGARLIQG